MPVMMILCDKSAVQMSNLEVWYYVLLRSQSSMTLSLIDESCLLNLVYHPYVVAGAGDLKGLARYVPVEQGRSAAEDKSSI